MKTARTRVRAAAGKICLGAVVANGFDRATFLGLFTASFLVRIFRLFINIGIPAVFVALEIVRCRLAAQVAINALVIDVELSRYVFGIFVCDVCHKFKVCGLILGRLRGLASPHLGKVTQACELSGVTPKSRSVVLAPAKSNGHDLLKSAITSDLGKSRYWTAFIVWLSSVTRSRVGL